jgi:sodium/hydrogen exchanger-like protein 6/7
MLLILVVCPLPIFSLWTPFYLQIKRIRVVHEALVPISTRMFVELIVTRLVPGNM